MDQGSSSANVPAPRPGVECVKVEVLVPSIRLDALEQALLDAGALSVVSCKVRGRWAPTSHQGPFGQQMQGAEHPGKHRACVMQKVEMVVPKPALAAVREAIDHQIRGLRASHCELRVLPILEHSTFAAVEPQGAFAFEEKHAIVFECIFDSDGLL